jgi:hypothetical protein
VGVLRSETVGVAVSLGLFLTGAVLAVAVDSPTSGANLQTAGVAVMLVALTALNVVVALRDSAPG